MKEVKFHGNNLFSICPIEDNELDRRYFFSLVCHLFDLGGHLIVESSRPNYENKVLLKRLLSLKSELIGLTRNSFALSYEYSLSSYDHEVLSLLVDIWFSYEQNKFSFFFDEDGYLSNEKNSEPESVKSGNRELHAPLNVIFGDGLQDIVWLQKNESLKLNEIL